MLAAGLANRLFDVELRALPRIELADADLDIRAKLLRRIDPLK